MAGRRYIKNNQGFTLLELIVVMGFFIVIIMISANAFEKIVSMSSQQIKSSESNIQGVVGLEVMRSDLEHAGYGLPWELSFVADFEENTKAANSLANGIDPKIFNDKNMSAAIDSNKVPRAIQSAAAAGAGDWENGRDYLVIKSAFVGMNTVAKKWSYVEPDVTTPSIMTIKEWGAENFVKDDWVITLDSKNRRLIGVDMDHFSYKVPEKSGGLFIPPVAYQPNQDTDVYLVYGIKDDSPASSLRAPYNRVDYYINRPDSNNDISARCAKGTGILYKAVLSHDGGDVASYPLLDCVADMQVIYSLDTNEDGGVDLHSDEDILSSMSSADIRKQLKEIRINILTHEGQKDKSFTYSNSTVQVGEFGRGRSYDLTKLDGIGNDWKNYRWKIYTLVVIPKNINN